MIINSLDLVYDELKKREVSISTKYDYVNKIKTKNKVRTLPLGRIWFNLIFPDDFELIDEEVNGDKLKSYIKKLYNQYDDPSIITNTLSLLNKESFKLATLMPSSFDINSLILPDFLIQKKKTYLTSDLTPDEFNSRLTEMGKELLDYLKSNNSGVYDVISSGAKGNPLLLSNLLLAKGSTCDIEGNVSHPITSSFNEGLSLEDYYSSSAEAR